MQWVDFERENSFENHPVKILKNIWKKLSRKCPDTEYSMTIFIKIPIYPPFGPFYPNASNQSPKN